MQATRLIDALLGVGEINNHIRAIQIANKIAVSEKFEIPDWIEGVKGTCEEVDKTIQVMKEHNIIRLPYPSIYIEIVCRFNNDIVYEAPLHNHKAFVSKEDQCKATRIGILAWETISGIEYECCMSPIFSYEKSWKRAALCPGSYKFNPDHIMRIQDNPKGYPTSKAANDIIKWFLFLMSAKGTSRIKYAAPEQLNKSRIRNRELPIDGYTKVLLPGFYKRQQEAKLKGATISERMAVRLHWRCGHERSQHYGLGSSLIKKIFIEPTLVGYEEEGTIYHLQYGQELPDEPL